MAIKNIRSILFDVIFKIIVKLEPIINKSVKVKIFFHDSNIPITKKARERCFKDHFLKYDKFPMGIIIEVSSGCNASCIMCRTAESKRAPGLMDDLIFKKIIDEWKTLKTKQLWMNWIGEPLLDPKLVDRIRYAKTAKKNSVIQLFSNASLLNNALSEKIIESGLDRIIFSIDGYSKETFETIRRGLIFENVITNVNNFIKLRNKAGRRKPTIAINFVRTKFNAHEEKQFKNEWSAKVEKIIVDAGLVQHQEYACTDVKIPFYGNRPPCPMLWTGMPIFVNGLVGLCCCFSPDDFIIGDVRKQTIYDIWNSDILKKYRQHHLEGRANELHLCNKCDYWKHVRADMPWYGNY